MKQEDCKVPIPEDRTAFVEKPNDRASSKTVFIVAGVLLLLVFSFTMAFTFLTLFELRQQVEELKFSVDSLQNIIKENSFEFGDDDYESEPIYDDPSFYDDSLVHTLLTNNRSGLEMYITGEKLIKDAEQATSPPRPKRSVIKDTPDGSESNELTRSTTKDNRSSVHPHLRTSREEPTRLKKMRSRSISPRTGDSYNPEDNPDVEFWEDQQRAIRTRHKARRLELEEPHARIGRMRPLPTVHYFGDTSKYVLGVHNNFNGNGHLRHPQRRFVDWAESSWVQALGMDRHFSLSDGFVTIKEPGLYFVYAQIYYYDAHDINGFRVYKNETETLLQCTTMTYSDDRIMKGNTCFTAGAAYFSEHDKISLADLSESRYSLFEPGKSFFGLIKLGDVKIK